MQLLLSTRVMGAACVCLLLGACREEEVGQTEDGRLVLGQSVVEHVERRGVTPGDRTLVLDGFNGTIQLQGTDAATAELEFVKRARGRDDVAARRVLPDVRIDESGDDTGYRYVMRSETPERTAVDVRGVVPRGANLRIVLETGTVLLSRIEGPLQVEVESGNVRIGGAGQRVSVEVQNGAIDLGMQRLPPDAAVRLRTANGNIALTLPGSADARVEAQTNVGSIHVEGLRFTSRQLDSRRAGARFTGRLGRSNALVDVQTRNGTILLREGTVEALPLEEGAPDRPADPVQDSVPSPGPDTLAPMQDSLRPSAPDTSLQADSAAAVEGGSY